MEKKQIEASELLILALLAGFFFALGSKLVHLFAYWYHWYYRPFFYHYTYFIYKYKGAHYIHIYPI